MICGRRNEIPVSGRWPRDDQDDPAIDRFSAGTVDACEGTDERPEKPSQYGEGILVRTNRFGGVDGAERGERSGDCEAGSLRRDDEVLYVLSRSAWIDAPENPTDLFDVVLFRILNTCEIFKEMVVTVRTSWDQLSRSDPVGIGMESLSLAFMTNENDAHGGGLTIVFVFKIATRSLCVNAEIMTLTA
jgi:hypothetical protein